MAATARSSFEVGNDLIRMAESDPGLARTDRQRFVRLRAELARSPDLALEHIDSLARDVAARLPREAPAVPLARCVGIEAFLRFYVTEAVREAFPDPIFFVDYLSALSDPRVFLETVLADVAVLIPALHSWLVEASAIAGLDGHDLRMTLAIRPHPPYVTLAFPLDKLLATDVTIRAARAVDAIPERLTEWSPAGLPGGVREYIDGDIPSAAVGPVEMVR